MANPVLMPKQGITVESCIITTWHKKVGDSVQRGEMLFSYETDKSAFDVEAETDGTLLAIFYPEQDDIPVLSVVAVIGQKGEDISAFLVKKSSAPEIALSQPTPIVVLPSVKEEVPDAVKSPISPRARAVAATLGVDPTWGKGTGPGGRIIERDVRALFSQTPALQKADAVPAPAASPMADPTYTDTKLSSIRRVIAQTMTASLATMAQLTLSSSFDATALLAQRALFKASSDRQIQGITLTDMVLFAVAKALQLPQHAHCNAHLQDNILRTFANVHLACAIDTPRGLLVPTLFDAQTMSLRTLSLALSSLAKQCREGTATPDQLTNATFTVSNLGGLGIEHFTPVINPPQTCILGLNNITYRPKNLAGTLYPAMGLSITFDHRALDGADAARFLQTLGKMLEEFTTLMAG